MEEELRKIYRCEYCKKISTSKSGMKRHELSCRKNPNNNVLCPFCRNLTTKEHYYSSFGGDECTEEEYEEYNQYATLYRDEPMPYTFTELICNNDNVRVYHPKVLNKDKSKIEFITNGAKVMPISCSNFKPMSNEQSEQRKYRGYYSIYDKYYDKDGNIIKLDFGL